MNTIYVRNIAQVTLLKKELQGQLSDGMWENAVVDSRYWDCEVKVAELGDLLGCNFKPHAGDEINFADGDLDFLYGRMIGYVIKETNEIYDEESLLQDLKDLTEIITWRI